MSNRLVKFQLQEASYQVLQGSEMARVVHRVRAKHECIRGLQSDGGAEIADGYGDGVAVVGIAGVAQQPYSRIRFTLDALANRHVRLQIHAATNASRSLTDHHTN